VATENYPIKKIKLT